MFWTKLNWSNFYGCLVFSLAKWFQVFRILACRNFRTAAGKKVLSPRLGHFRAQRQDQRNLLQLQQHQAPVGSCLARGELFKSFALFWKVSCPRSWIKLAELACFNSPAEYCLKAAQRLSRLVQPKLNIKMCTAHKYTQIKNVWYSSPRL